MELLFSCTCSCHFINKIFFCLFEVSLLNPFLYILPLCCGNDMLLKLCLYHEISYFSIDLLVISGNASVWKHFIPQF